MIKQKSYKLEGGLDFEVYISIRSDFVFVCVYY